ncbi:hypothetical protein RV03_GL000841 [Enterococcus gallinarum]|nr:hypothetical protein RV03_GL000841 [Enterococcus gallinarum]
MLLLGKRGALAMSNKKISNAYFAVAFINFLASLLLLFAKGNLAKVASMIFFISFMVYIGLAIKKRRT